MGEILRALASSFIGTLGFALLLRTPRRAILPASLIGMFAYFLYWVLLRAGLSDPMAVFVGALIGSLLGQACARRMHMIATIFILLSIVPAVPGLGLYRFMELLGSDRMALGMEAGVAAMMSIAMIALGVGVGSFLFRLLAGHHAWRAAAKTTKDTSK